MNLLIYFLVFLSGSAVADSLTGACVHHAGGQFKDQVSLPELCHKREVLGAFGGDLESFLAQHNDPSRTLYWRDRRRYLINHMLGKHPAAGKPDREKLRECLKAIHALNCSPTISKAAQDFLFDLAADEQRQSAAGPSLAPQEKVSATGSR